MNVVGRFRLTIRGLYFGHLFYVTASCHSRTSPHLNQAGAKMSLPLSLLSRLWSDDQGQDIAEYAVMLAVILVLVVGTIRLVGSNANNVFSTAASAMQ